MKILGLVILSQKQYQQEQDEIRHMSNKQVSNLCFANTRLMMKIEALKAELRKKGVHV